MSRKLRILTIGKRHDKAVAPLIEEYESRLRARLSIQWQYLPHETSSDHEHKKQITAESNAIRSTLKEAEYVIVLDDTGTQLSSESFSETLHDLTTAPQDICFIIGGAYGVDDALLEQADFVWSLGKLTLPHQLVRSLLVEQLYRAVSIWDGRKYHHGD
jgi:23S rRNA (pseudouridine1915-N3)-methyltransferase